MKRLLIEELEVQEALEDKKKKKKTSDFINLCGCDCCNNPLELNWGKFSIWMGWFNGMGIVMDQSVKLKEVWRASLQGKNNIDD